MWASATTEKRRMSNKRIKLARRSADAVIRNRRARSLSAVR